MIDRHFDFRTSFYGLFLASAVTDGTTNPQTIATYAASWVRPIHPLDPTGWFVEPARARTAGQGCIDDFTRLVVFCTRIGNVAGAWTYSLGFRRNTGGAQETRVLLTGQPIVREVSWDTVNDVPQVFDDLFPHDFMRQAGVGAPDIDDTLNFQVTVTPATATADMVRFWGLMLPGNGRQAPEGGRGYLVGDRIR